MENQCARGKGLWRAAVTDEDARDGRRGRTAAARGEMDEAFTELCSASLCLSVVCAVLCPVLVLGPARL